MKKIIFIFSDGQFQRKGNTLYFETKKGEKKYLPVENISEIMVMGEVDLNKRFLEFLSQTEIILHFFNHYGYYIGSFYPRQHYNSGYIILKQAEFYNDERKRISLAKKIFNGAVENIEKVLTYYSNRGKEVGGYIKEIENLKEKVDNCNSIEEIMAIEGNIREHYYSSFDKILEDEEFIFEKRSRRPPRNKLNTLISFGNSLLYVAVLSEIYKTHLDPRIGFLHTTNFRRFTLNLDIAEVFKPIIVDRIIFTLVNKKIIQQKHFEDKMGGLILKDPGKQIFVEEFDNRLKTTIKHKGLGRNVSYRRLIRMELYKIEKHLIGEEEYKPFVSGW
ncbi:MAG TPA: type I-B CRISPR-associated endonuclease Cas1b [Candidatus Ratteibacteria bacterium]|nr:type I-B CRISPR-associated endonuclease Cas1b [Candidatus Ratteibacteria bacterium]